MTRWLYFVNRTISKLCCVASSSTLGCRKTGKTLRSCARDSIWSLRCVFTTKVEGRSSNAKSSWKTGALIIAIIQPSILTLAWDIPRSFLLLVVSKPARDDTRGSHASGLLLYQDKPSSLLPPISLLCQIYQANLPSSIHHSHKRRITDQILPHTTQLNGARRQVLRGSSRKISLSKSQYSVCRRLSAPPIQSQQKLNTLSPPQQRRTISVARREGQFGFLNAEKIGCRSLISPWTRAFQTLAHRELARKNNLTDFNKTQRRVIGGAMYLKIVIRKHFGPYQAGESPCSGLILVERRWWEPTCRKIGRQGKPGPRNARSRQKRQPPAWSEPLNPNKEPVCFKTTLKSL